MFLFLLARLFAFSLFQFTLFPKPRPGIVVCPAQATEAGLLNSCGWWRRRLWRGLDRVKTIGVEVGAEMKGKKYTILITLLHRY